MDNFTDIFKTITNAKQVKRLYFQLAQKHHPDKGGDDASFRALNDAYLARLAQLDGQYYAGKDAGDLKFTFDKDEEEKIIAKIQEFFELAPQYITLDLVGSWLWANNTTKADAEFMKSLKFRWSNDKKMWYYTTKFKHIHYKNKNGFDTIAFKYGCTRLGKHDEEQKVLN